MRTTQSASSMLYNGETRDFLHAMQLVLDQCGDEECNAPSYVDEYWTESDRARLLAGLNQMRAQTLEADAIYRRIMKEAEKQVCAALIAAGLEGYASALETGDYSELAI